jgi:WD40 repeat protein
MNKFLSIILCSLILSFAHAQKLETSLQNGHAREVTCTDFHPNGKWAVSGSKDNSILLWNLDNGKIIRHFSYHTANVWSVDIHPTKNWLLSSSAGQTVIVSNIETGEIIHNWKIDQHNIQHAYFSNGGGYVLMFTNRDEYFVYDLKSGKKLAQYTKNYGASYQRNVFNESKKLVLSTAGYKGAEVLMLEGDTVMNIPFDKVYGMEFSPDGQMIALSSAKLFAEIFNAETGEKMHELRDPDSEQRCDGCNTKQVWSHDSRYLVTMSNRSAAILWDAKSGKKLKTLLSLDDRPTVLRFSQDDKYIAINVDETLYVFDSKTGKKTMEYRNDLLEYFDLNFSSQHNHLLLPGKNNVIELWDVARGVKIKELKGYLNAERNDGLDFMYSNWSHTGILKQINLKRGFDISPDQRILAFGGVDSVCQVVDLKTGRILKTLLAHNKIVVSVAFSPDGETLATASGDRKIILWNTENWTIKETLKGHVDVVFDLKFSEDGQKIISGSWDGSFIVWDLKSGNYNRKSINKNSPYTVGFGPGDLYYLVGDNYKNLQFVESDSYEDFRSLVGHTDVISAMELDESKQYLASSSWDGKLKVWDYRSGMQVAKYSGHEGAIYGLSWHPSKRVIASVGADNDLHVWDVVSNERQQVESAHNTSITDVQFSKDGSKIYTMSVDGMLKAWEYPSLKELYGRIQISRTEWLSTHPSGHFDGSSKSLKLVNYVSGMEVLPIGSLFDKYYSPQLIQRLNQGEKFDLGTNINELMKESPEVAFVKNNQRNGGKGMSEIVSSKQTMELDVEVSKENQNIEEIRLYNNNKLLEIKGLKEDIAFRGNSDVKKFSVELSNGMNELKVVAKNSDGTESSPDFLTVKYSGKSANTDLFILSIGINDYQNSQYNLAYAVGDAKAFSKSLEKGADTLFNEIYLKEILNKDATKESVIAAFKEIKSKIGPEDVFVFYYAGHGVMSLEDIPEFYLVSHDVTNLYGNIDQLKSKGISAAEILTYSMELSAEKQLFVLDACHSGGAIESFATRGDGREKALAQLARSTGTYFLTASQDAQYANEVGELKHGLFTFALLEILSGKGDNGDNKITVNELKTHAEDRVPELSQTYQGSTQYPTSYSFGQDFPLVIVR